MKRALKLVSIFLIIILTGVFIGGIFREAKDFVRQNIYVWTEKDPDKLPIYCVDTKEKVISMTFDVAWGNEDMEEILQILKKEKVKATFFFSGEWISKYSEDVKKIYKQGHDVGNHGDHHKYMTKLSKEEQREEIRGAGDKAKSVLNMSIDLFRPPYGDYNEEVIKTAEEMGYYSVQWSIDSLDWMDLGTENIIHKVCEHKALEPGAIILMHTGTKYTKEALGPIIRNLKKKGYRFVPVSKMIYRNNYRMDPAGKQIKY